MNTAQQDLYHTILSLRTIREFTKEPITDESLDRILEAGRWSGSAKNVQPWHFIVIRNNDRLIELSKCGSYAQHLPGAQVAVAIVSDPVRAASFDAGRAAQNMMLAAWAEGIGSGIATMHDQACAKKVLRIPEDKDITIVLDFGYPASKPAKGVSPYAGRRSKEEVIHHEQWQGKQ
jgi:nitroreductase